MTFNISEVEATQTLIYTPDSYLEYCQENGEEPTEDGYLSYLRVDLDEDFGGFQGSLLLRYLDAQP
jgi:hypothetical protein